MPGRVLAAWRFEIGLIPEKPGLVRFDEIGYELSRLSFKQPLLEVFALFPKVFLEDPAFSVIADLVFNNAFYGRAF